MKGFKPFTDLKIQRSKSQFQINVKIKMNISALDLRFDLPRVLGIDLCILDLREYNVHTLLVCFSREWFACPSTAPPWRDDGENRSLTIILKS